MSFHTIKIDTLEYLAAENIAAPHCFTTRLGGVCTGYAESLNLAVSRDTLEHVTENYRRLGAILGFGIEDLVLTCQVHGDTVRKVTRADHNGLKNKDYPPCDALITNDPGTALVVFTADCTPILLHDPVTGAVGAIHAGWRGTAADIAGKTVAAMAAEFGCDPKNIRAAIGPNIGPCCFETDGDVPRAMEDALGEAAGPHIRQVGEKYFLDLKAINALFLRNRGVGHIEVSTDCTMCQPDRFWSHRYTRGNRGSQGAIILCKEETI